MSPRTTHAIPNAPRAGLVEAGGEERRSTTVMSVFTRELLQVRCGLPRAPAVSPAAALQLEPADHAATWSAGSPRRMLALVIYVLLLWSAVVIKTFVW